MAYGVHASFVMKNTIIVIENVFNHSFIYLCFSWFMTHTRKDMHVFQPQTSHTPLAWDRQEANMRATSQHWQEASVSNRQTSKRPTWDQRKSSFLVTPHCWFALFSGQDKRSKSQSKFALVANKTNNSQSLPPWWSVRLYLYQEPEQQWLGLEWWKCLDREGGQRLH